MARKGRTNRPSSHRQKTHISLLPVPETPLNVRGVSLSGLDKPDTGPTPRRAERHRGCGPKCGPNARRRARSARLPSVSMTLTADHRARWQRIHPDGWCRRASGRKSRSRMPPSPNSSTCSTSMTPTRRRPRPATVGETRARTHASGTRQSGQASKALLPQPGGFEGHGADTREGCPARRRRAASMSLRQRTRENLFSDFDPDSFRFSNTHFPATPLKSPEPPVTLSLESWGRMLPRYLMSPEPPISPLR
jgi:hypothetical protein